MPSVVQTLIDFLAAPPLEVLTLALDANGPYGPGNHSFTTWLQGATTRALVDTYGVYVQWNGAIPPELGRELGYDDGVNVSGDRFSLRVAQLVTMQNVASGGHVPSHYYDVRFLPSLFRWEDGVPAQLGLYVLPGASIDLFYLVIA
jgi:hypothetical protein